MTTVTQAVAERDEGPGALIKRYESDFATVLPSHIKAETWVRLAQGALRRNPTLEQAARANPGSLLAVLLDAARLGLEPGTEQYYLVPYKDKGKLIVQGVPGYQGEIELMYRAGAVSSVVVEVVREGDTFTYVPGRDERPLHEVDWFGGNRGPLLGVYAYAVMTDGATSKVVVLSKAEVYEARGKSASYRFKPESSPWTTDEAAMWLKTGAHRLRKWVPTSAEYRRELARASAEAQNIANSANASTGPAPHIDLSQSEDFVEGEVLEQAAEWPEVAEPADAP